MERGSDLPAKFIWAPSVEHQQRLLAEGWKDCGPHTIHQESHLMMRRITEATRQASLLDGEVEA
jgi:hypothetical protein